MQRIIIFYRDYLEIYDTQYSFSQVLKSYKLPDGSKKLFTFPDAEVNWPYITASVYNLDEDFVMCPGHYRSVIHYGGGDAVDKHTTYDKKSDPDFCKKGCCGHGGKNNKTEVNVYDKDSCGRYFFLVSGCSADGLGTEDTYIYNIALKQNAVKPNLATYISDYHSYYTNELADMCSFYITNEPDSDEPIEDDKTTPVNPDDDNPINQDPDNSDEHCKEAAPAIMPCGKQWDDSTCALVDISNFPPECGTGYEFNSKDEV